MRKREVKNLRRSVFSEGLTENNYCIVMSFRGASEHKLSVGL